jgi:RimJ/RimL family protein N-acetyltransferase
MSAMVTELETSRFGGTRPLWREMWMHLAVESILEGRTAARMFVDDAAKPRAVMTWTGHRLYLSGDMDGAGFSEVLNTQYVPSHRWFVTYCSSKAIDSAVMLFLGKVARRGRIYYEGDPSKYTWEVKPPEEYVIEQITRSLLDRGLAHTDWVMEEMTSERSSIEEFLGKSFGFVALHRGEFACWCMSEYNLGDRCEVGIETVKGHRRKGLASLVAGAMFGYAADMGVRRIGWHCWTDNVGSLVTAEKLGLKRVAEFPALFVNAEGV